MAKAPKNGTGGKKSGRATKPKEPVEPIPLTAEELFNIATGATPCKSPKLKTEARAYAALFMRRQGYDYRTIATQLSISLSWAFDLVKKTINAHQADEVDTIRALHLQRLETMLQPVLDRANEGDTFSIQSAMQIMARIETMMGIEPPKKVEVNFGDQTNDARAALFKAISALPKS